MTTWNTPKLVALSGAYDSEAKVATGLKEAILHLSSTSTVQKAAFTTS